MTERPADAATVYKFPASAVAAAHATQWRLAYVVAACGAVVIAMTGWVIWEVYAHDVAGDVGTYVFVPLLVAVAFTVAGAVYFFRRAGRARSDAEAFAVVLDEDGIGMATARGSGRGDVTTTVDDDGRTWTRFSFGEVEELRHYGGSGLQVVPRSRPPVLLPARLENFDELVARLDEREGVREMPGGRYGGALLQAWRLTPIAVYYAMAFTTPGWAIVLGVVGIGMVVAQAVWRRRELFGAGFRGYFAAAAYLLFAAVIGYRTWAAALLLS